MIMSFFLTDTERISHDASYCKHRFFRLLVPQIVWAIAYWLFYNGSHILLHTNTKENIFSLFWQIAFGCTVNVTMWYQTDLIFLTVLFSLFFFLCNKRTAYRCLPLFAFSAIFLVYSGLGSKMTQPLRDEMRVPLARLIGMVSFSVIGLLFRAYQIPQRLHKKQMPVLIYAGISLLFCLSFKLFCQPQHDTGYGEISLVVNATLLFVFFFLLPLEKLPQKTLGCISFVSKCTMGIYCMHRMIRHIFRTITNLEGKDLLFSCLVFAASLLISAVLSQMPWKWIRNSVS